MKRITTRKSRISNFCHKTAIFLFVLFLANIFFYGIIYAATTVYGRITDQTITYNGSLSNIHRGYFHNEKFYSGSGDKVLPTYASKSSGTGMQFGVGDAVAECTSSDGSNKSTVLSQNDVNEEYAIPECIDSPVEFVNFLRNKNSLTSNGYNDTRRKIGSAYIVQSMLGRNGPGYGSCLSSYYCDISAADFTTLQNLLTDYDNVSQINWNKPSLPSEGLDSMFGLTSSTSFYDIFAFEEDVTRDGIDIFNSSGTSLYKLWRFCGNPIGRLKGIDPFEWPVDPTSWSIYTGTEVNPSQAAPGQLVTWKHKIRNTLLSDNTTLPVDYGYVTTSSSFASIPVDNSGVWLDQLPIGTDPTLLFRALSTRSSTATIPATALHGDQVCRATYAEPQNQDPLSGRTVSSEKCVTVMADWDMQAKSKININGGLWSSPGWTIPDAKPGEKLSWKHEVENKGDAKSTEKVKYGYRPISGSDIYVNELKFDNSGPDSKRTYFYKDSPPYTITQDDVDHTLCSSAYAVKKSMSGGTEWSTPACAYVPYDYELKPTITTDPTNIAVPGGSMTVKPKVDNQIGPTKSRPTHWDVKVYINDIYQSPPLAEGNNVVFDPIVTDLGTYNYSVPATLNVGDKLCFRLTVKPWNDNPFSGEKTVETCVFVGKMPKVQVWGGDVRSRNGDVETSLTNETANTYGSWAEYAILAKEKIIGMASGSALASIGHPLVSDICTISMLSFTNAGPATCSTSTPKGKYTITGNQPNVSASFSAATSLPTDWITNTTSGNYVYNTTGNETLPAGTLAVGRRVVINATGHNITISGNIRYQDVSLNDIKNIPQLVIIADNINIQANVKNVDAWLVATTGDGIINTCSNVPLSDLKSGTCFEQLTINGPVIAKELKLRRTAKSDNSTKADPAEIINLRADAYLWGASQATAGNRLRTVYSTELPPRF